MNSPHTGNLLFHCWPHADQQAGQGIFENIVERGLLLTVNSGPLDSFRYYSGTELVRIDIMQLARVCFTEIPARLLHTHGYGHFGIGFSRRTLVDWGGCPAWYLPNHPGKSSLKECGAEAVRSLHSSAVALDQMRAFVRDIPPVLKKHIPEKYLSRDFDFEVKFTHGTPLKGQSLLDWITRSELSLRRTLSFVKELSPSDVEDFRYLYEREWRIVDGVGLPGKVIFSALTDAEKSALCKVRNAWGEKIKSEDINVQLRAGDTRLVDHFRYFNGIDLPVSRLIEVVLVPDRAAKRGIETYIAANRARFRQGGPKVELFPSNVLRRLSWQAKEVLATR
jgi:hypothetical protein